MRREPERLQDTLDAIARIEEYAARGRGAFDVDPLIQNWIVRHIEIIGEACRALPPEFRARFPAVPWKEIIGMRTILVHHYFDIDTEAVWAVVENDLPPLKHSVGAILKQLASGA